MSLIIFLLLFLAFFAFMMMLTVLSRQNLTEQDKAKTAQPIISDAGVRELVAQGHIDDAVDLYRRFTGVDLFTAKTAVSDMQIEMRLAGSEDELRRLIRLGDKAGAIELYQQAAGVSLAEALAAVEAIEQQKGR